MPTVPLAGRADLTDAQWVGAGAVAAAGQEAGPAPPQADGTLCRRTTTAISLTARPVACGRQALWKGDPILRWHRPGPRRLLVLLSHNQQPVLPHGTADPARQSSFADSTHTASAAPERLLPRAQVQETRCKPNTAEHAACLGSAPKGR